MEITITEIERIKAPQHLKEWLLARLRRQQERNRERDHAINMAIICNDFSALEQIEKRLTK